MAARNVAPLAPTNPVVAHKVLVSVVVLIAVAFIAQGVGNSSAGAHQVIVALLAGVILILGIQLQAGSSSTLTDLAAYPWLPPATPAKGG